MGGSIQTEQPRISRRTRISPAAPDDRCESAIKGDSIEGFDFPSQFVIPGESVVSVKSVVKNPAFAIVQGLSLLQLDGGLDPDRTTTDFTEDTDMSGRFGPSMRINDQRHFG
jgi:hypothetical protein